MKFLNKVLADSDKTEPMSIRLADVMLLDPDFQKLKQALSGLLIKLSRKYQLDDQQIVEIALDHLKNPHKSSIF